MADHLLYAKIISDLEGKINDAHFVEGQKLPSERRLASYYQVSRTVVREAVKVLSEKGLVNAEIGKGTYITKPTSNNVTEVLQRIIHSSDSSINDILEVREELEIAIMKKAVERATADKIKHIKNLCKTMDDEHISVSEFVKRDAEFHLELAKLTGNNIFYLLISSFYNLTDKALVNITHMIPSDIEETRRQHWLFVQAITDRDQELAKKIVKMHIALIRNEVKYLQDKKLLK